MGDVGIDVRAHQSVVVVWGTDWQKFPVKATSLRAPVMAFRGSLEPPRPRLDLELRPPPGVSVADAHSRADYT